MCVLRAPDLRGSRIHSFQERRTSRHEGPSASTYQLKLCYAHLCMQLHFIRLHRMHEMRPIAINDPLAVCVCQSV